MNGLFGFSGFPGMDNSNVSDVTANSLDVTDNIEISRASSTLPIHAGESTTAFYSHFNTFYGLVICNCRCVFAHF